MDIKMELFCSKQLWEDAIEHGLDKRMNKSLLYALTDPVGRATIAEAIVDGRYEVQPPKVIEVPKANNKVRQVYCCQPLDRVVLHVISNIYFQLYGHLIHPACRSYQKGMSVKKTVDDVVEKLKDGYHGYKCDLSKYFDNVNKETLFATLDELSTNSPIDKVVRQCYEDDRYYVDGKLEHKYLSLRQGNSLGVFLANIVLRDIDEELSKMDIIYYRYSDDLLLLGSDADKALAKLKEMLIPKGLELNPKKVERIDSNAIFTFLGAKIHGQTIDISDDSVERFKKEIRSITKVRKGMKLHSRAEQRRAIKKINNYLYLSYMKNPENFGWGFYFYSLCTTDKTIRELDCFVKDHIKAMYTGKWNAVTNMHKTSNEELEQMGYLSMVHMYKLFKMNKEVFKAEILRKK